MAPYLSHLGRHRQLTREEEVALADRIRRGDQEAKDLLALSNLALVVSVAKKYTDRGGRTDDLVQEGNIGLLKAIDHYDPRKGTRFATYAVWWIRAYIQRFLQENRSQVRGGEAHRAGMTDLSLDITVDEDGEVSHLDRLVDEKANPEADYLTSENARNVRVALQRVKKRIGDLGWDILQERLTQDTPRTLEEIGKRWGVSRERVRQVEMKTKVFLARYLEPIAA
jgi:RNA polymerase primary sigma factor